MDNVLFKRGLSSALATATVENGAFYLTTDTHKLYYGYNNKINLLDSVIMVDKLPTNNIEVGYFYYATIDNILAIYDGSAWTQVNPDSQFVLTSFESEGKVEDNTAIVTHTLSYADNVHNDVDGATTTNNLSVAFSIKGEDGITVAVDGTEITLTGTKYEYDLAVADSEAGAEIALTLNGETDAGAVAIAAGANAEVKAADGTITIGAKDTEVTGVEFANGADGGIDLTVTSKVTKADGTTEDKTATDNFNITVGYGVEEDKKATASIKNGQIDLSVYTAAEVDEKLSGFIASFNAMEFKGAVASVEELPADAEPGFTYKASAEFTLDETNIKVGDLIIATTDEWVVIPSGDETVLTYELGLDVNNRIILKENGNEKGNAISITDVENNPVQVEITKDEDTQTIVAKVIHTAITVKDTETEAISQTAGAAQEFTIVVDVIDDGFGHITEIKTQKITVVDTKVTGVTEEVSNTDAGVKIGTSIAQTAGDPITTEYYIESSSLSIREGEANDIKVIVDLVWGSF